MQQRKCAQFDSKGKHCNNPAELLMPEMPLDFCAMHNHINKAGIALKCWRCGDKEPI